MRFPIVMSVFLAGPALGADIQANRIDNDEAVITIAGDIVLEDIAKFKQLSSSYPKATVMLRSDGGNALAGIQIGSEIRMKGYKTLVPPTLRCASSCALIWLGGSTRFMANSSYVGFHTVYDARSGEVSGPGAALAGAYLNRIGLPDRAVVYIMNSKPTEITWLTPQDAKAVGIDVEVWQPQSSAPLTNSGPPRGATSPSAHFDAADMADARRLAANAIKRYGEAGLGGLSQSVVSCYQRALELRNERSIRYCFALDVVRGTKAVLSKQTTSDADTKAVIGRFNFALQSAGTPYDGRRLNTWVEFAKLANSYVMEGGAP